MVRHAESKMNVIFHEMTRRFANKDQEKANKIKYKEWRKEEQEYANIYI